MTSTIPTEPIGSIPRPPELLQAVQDHAAGKTSLHTLEGAYDDAIKGKRPHARLRVAGG